MSTTIREIMKLPCMQESRVIAGAELIDRTIATITVTEYTHPGALQNQLYELEGPRYNELTLTGLFDIADNPEAQCDLIRLLLENGIIAMVLYYLGIVVKKLDPRVIETANEIGFVIILMPENRYNLRYSDAIMEITHLIDQEQSSESYFIPELLDQFSLLQKNQRGTDILLRMISDRTRMSYIITNAEWEVQYYATWPFGLSIDLQEILEQVSESRAYLNISTTLYYYQIIHLKNRSSNLRNLIVFSPTASQLQTFAKQSGELICLSANIWGMQYQGGGANELIRALILGEPMRIRRIARLMNVDLSRFGSMWLIIPKAAENPTSVHELSVVLKRLQNDHLFDYAVMGQYENAIVICASQSDYHQTEKIQNHLLTMLSHENTAFRIYFCSNLNSVLDYRRIYLLISKYGKDSCLLFPYRRVICMEDIEFTRECRTLLTQADNTTASDIHPSLSILKKDPPSMINGSAFSPKDKTPSSYGFGSELFHQIVTTDPELTTALRQTLATYLLDAEGSVAKTAELMFVHKNTVKYRLNKINDILNLNIHQLTTNFLLTRAVALERLLSRL